MDKPFAADRRSTPLLFDIVDPKVVRRIQRSYIELFNRRAERPVLDLGCGRGIFLEMLREADVKALGIDVNEEALAYCRRSGLEVREAPIQEGLRSAREAGERFSGVFCSHVIEHLHPPEALELLEGVAEVLDPGSRAVFVTPNPRSLEVLQDTFWLDPTHIRFYPRRLIEQIGRSVGLEVYRSFDDPNSVPPKNWYRGLKVQLHSLLVGFDLNPPMDSVVVFQKS